MRIAMVGVERSDGCRVCARGTLGHSAAPGDGAIRKRNLVARGTSRTPLRGEGKLILPVDHRYPVRVNVAIRDHRAVRKRSRTLKHDVLTGKRVGANDDEIAN